MNIIIHVLPITFEIHSCWVITVLQMPALYTNSISRFTFLQYLQFQLSTEQSYFTEEINE